MEFVPSNIIKTPDFGAMAQNAMQQKRQDIKEMNDWMDANKKKEGAYLEGDKPAVQEAWNAYQQQLDKYVESESPTAKRAADEAYGKYAQIAGTAMANAQQYRSQVAAYKADPSKFSISGQEFLSLSDEYRRTRRSADELIEAVNNPFVISQSMKYDLADPVTQSQKMLQMSSAKLNDFYSEDGTLNRSAARSHAEYMAEAFINANESSVEKALAWGGVREGLAGGEDGMINSMEELEFLRSQPEDKRQMFIDKYKEELVNDFMRLLPGKKQEKKDGKKGGLILEQYDVELPTSDPESPQAATFQAFAKPLTGTMKNIVGFGENKLGEFLVQEVVEVETRDSKGNKIKKQEKNIRKAEPNEIARIKAELRKDYNISFSEKSVSSQEESANGGMTDAEYQQWLKDNGLDG
jgi:hypothetical protein